MNFTCCCLPKSRTRGHERDTGPQFGRKFQTHPIKNHCKGQSRRNWPCNCLRMKACGHGVSLTAVRALFLGSCWGSFTSIALWGAMFFFKGCVIGTWIVGIFFKGFNFALYLCYTFLFPKHPGAFWYLHHRAVFPTVFPRRILSSLQSSIGFQPCTTPSLLWEIVKVPWLGFLHKNDNEYTPEN